jgi:uncharacterized protein YkwD
MTRPNFRRSLRFENLESRELLSGTAPTSEQQYMLEMVNSARTSPAATADWLRQNVTPEIKATLDHYRVDLDSTLRSIASTPAKPPVAWNSSLADAALSHSQDMANARFQSHSGSDGSTVDSRIQRAGYGAADSTAENAYAYADDVKQAMEAFLLDWGVADQGHRRNVMQGNVGTDRSFKEVGIGIARTNKPGFGPVVVTQNFARPATVQPALLGVAYNDTDGTGRYTPGKGQGGVRVDATNLDTGDNQSADTSDTGAYQMTLPRGRYQVTASRNERVIQSSRVDVGSDNVKIDFVLTNRWDGRGRQDVINSVRPGAAARGMAAPARAAAPTPTPTAAPMPISAKVSTDAPTTINGWTSWKANRV